MTEQTTAEFSAPEALPIMNAKKLARREMKQQPDAPKLELRKDLREAARTMGAVEARFLVDQYYVAQECRKGLGNQMVAMEKAGEPMQHIAWIYSVNEQIEEEIKRWLDRYTDDEPLGVGRWLKDTTGIGPVIAAGLLAHIDINKAPAAGNIWSFAGQNPNARWEKGQRRPWNASLKRLCYLIGESFVKTSNLPKSEYGPLYRKRKDYEIARNESGGNADAAKLILETKKIGKDTEAYKAYIAGKLPDAQIHRRACRWVVKLFLSHLHDYWRRAAGLEVRYPYALVHLRGHMDYIPVPRARQSIAETIFSDINPLKDIQSNRE